MQDHGGGQLNCQFSRSIESMCSFLRLCPYFLLSFFTVFRLMVNRELTLFSIHFTWCPQSILNSSSQWQWHEVHDKTIYWIQKAWTVECVDSWSQRRFQIDKSTGWDDPDDNRKGLLKMNLPITRVCISVKIGSMQQNIKAG